MEKKKRSKTKRILLWILGILAGIILVIGVVVYFYWSNLIEGALEDTVKRETKGLYKADVGSVYYGIFGGNLYIRKLSLMPDTAVYNAMNPDSAPAILFGLTVRKITVLDFDLKKALFSKRIEAKRIDVKSPELKIWRKKIPVPDTTGKPKDTTQSIPLPGGWDYISVGTISLVTGSLTYIDQATDSVKEFTIPYVDIQVVNLWVDSTWRTDPRIYNTDDIAVTLRDIEQQTGNGMYAMHFGEVGLSTGHNLVYIDRFHLEPLFNRHEFSRKLGYQTDRMDVQVQKILLSGIDWKELMLDKRLVAGKLRIDSLVLDDYRDKRVPMRPGFKPPMPQQLIRGLKTYVWIDSLEVANGKATYSEQVSNEPGTIFFNRINGLLKGFTNDSVWLAEKKVSPLTAEAYIAGSGKLQATVRFIFGDTRNRFTLSAELSRFDLTKINPMLSKLEPAEIESGMVKKMVIPKIQFNDDFSIGNLTFYYDNLSFKMFKEKNTAWDGIKTGLINFVATDFLINKSNPLPNGKLNTGVVYFQRDKHKSIINFIWKSIFSGLKSNMGFNTKEQKAIKKGKNSRRVKKQ
ncbi:MAG: DUF748 domain-containing protein [Bacteroidales bacterium]|nr:DUF748 domain-containing protein [Bacteroidales bacterium]